MSNTFPGELKIFYGASPLSSGPAPKPAFLNLFLP